jgi:transposase
MAPSSLQQTNGVPHATAERLRKISTLIAVTEMGQASWLIAAIVPGLNRHPLKKIAADEEQLLQVLRRWKKEAETAGRMIKRAAVAYEAGRDGF